MPFWSRPRTSRPSSLACRSAAHFGCFFLPAAAWSPACCLHACTRLRHGCTQPAVAAATDLRTFCPRGSAHIAVALCCCAAAVVVRPCINSLLRTLPLLRPAGCVAPAKTAGQWLATSDRDQQQQQHQLRQPAGVDAVACAHQLDYRRMQFGVTGSGCRQRQQQQLAAHRRGLSTFGWHCRSPFARCGSRSPSQLSSHSQLCALPLCLLAGCPTCR